MTSLSFRDLHTPHTLVKETRNEIIKFDNCPKYSLTHELEIRVFSANGETWERWMANGCWLYSNERAKSSAEN